MCKYFIMHKHFVVLFCGVVLFSNLGCRKFLETKSSKSLSIPKSLVDLQALLDDYNAVNHSEVGAGMAGGDEYSLTKSQFNSLRHEEYRNMYIWADSNVILGSNNGWVKTYDNVYRANTILEVIGDIDRNVDNKSDWDNVKGEALFLRGRSFFEIAMIWAEAFNMESAKTKLGIPLRLRTDFNVPSVRSNIEDTYEQIISDLRASISLLPIKPVHVYRASKPAACGELARVYLSMRMYDSAYHYSNLALQYFDQLLDYNTLDTTEKYPFIKFGPEVVYFTTLFGTFSPFKHVDSVIYKLYDSNDLRKVLFFEDNGDGSYQFCGSYSNTMSSFGGIASDELYLTRAECLVRLDKPILALEDLNTLLQNRYLEGAFVPRQSGDSREVLKWILDERLKELLFRGLRWMDIKRLNLEGANIVLKRKIGDTLYLLQPNDLRYAMAIPQDIIDNSGIQQNPR